MSAPALALFNTAIGRCGIAWNGDAVVAFALPEESDERTRTRLLRHVGGAAETAPQAGIAAAVELVCRLLEGEPIDLSAVVVDPGAVSEFDRDIYRAARAIPHGAVVTYGALAEAAGHPGAARAVGVALGRNPVPVIVPCHRILAAGGRSGGFSAPGGVATKFRLLEIERARPSGEAPSLFADLPLRVSPS